MIFNKYVKLLLILGIFAVVPAQAQQVPLTQTMQHLIKNSKAVEVAQRFVANEDRKSVATQILAKEEALQNDYYTFVHGHNAGYYFPLKMYTFLWQIHTKKEIKDFIFPNALPLIESEKDIAAEERLRVHLIENGQDGCVYPDYLKVISMNYALFANSTNIGSTSSLRIKGGEGSRYVFLKLREPFKIFNRESIYQKFRNEIIALATEYNQKSTCGNALLIAIPKKKIRDCAFTASVGGHKTTIFISGIGWTSDMKIIMETLRSNPEKMKNTDVNEFCLILTKNAGMDPDSGIKIIPMLSGDPAKLAELQKKEYALFAKIKVAIEEEENAKAQATAVTRANTIVNHLVLPGKDAQGVMPAKTMARINNILGHIQPQQQIN